MFAEDEMEGRAMTTGITDVDWLDETVCKLSAENENLRRLVGYLIMDRGREGEALIGNGTLQRYDKFTIETEEVHAGMLVRAIPQE